MIHMFNLMCFCLLVGVFGDTEMKSVLEGDSVTLQTDLTEIQRVKEIEWWYKNTCIARINRSNYINLIYEDNDETQRFKGRLKLNNQTGDLTITDIKTHHSGDYHLNIFFGNKPKVKGFSLTAYALPVPVITNDISQCSSSHCSLLCSVMNVRDVSLSWYKGNSLLSFISVSDLNISNISLPLEVEHKDTNTYSCVVNNHIGNQTQDLNINHLCWLCSDLVRRRFLILAVIAASGMAAVAAVIVLGCDIKSRRYEQKTKQTPTTSDE